MTKIKTFLLDDQDFEQKVNEFISNEGANGWHVSSTHTIPQRQMTDTGEIIIYKFLIVLKK